MPDPSIQEMVALARAAAAEAADYQERFAAEDIEARKIVNIMEHFLRAKGRVVYGGAAINAHMPPDKKFYDPRLNLPDYDFMTPDPLQDCADLIVTFQAEGFMDVEAKFGIHEGTYKIFVNFRSAADITYMPPEIYDRIVADSHSIEGIHYASPNYLRMNMYLELSRPAGMVSRWEKVYQRLLLLNEAHPIKAGHCTAEPLKALGSDGGRSKAAAVHDRIVEVGIESEVVFLSGASYLVNTHPSPDEVVILMSPRRHEVARAIAAAIKTPTLHFQEFPAQGELLPARTELHARTLEGPLVAVVFDTVACHSYTTLKDPAGYRLGSIDLLIQMYYAFHFAELSNLLEVRLMCVIQELVDLESEKRRGAAARGGIDAAREVFPMDCIGHQPSMPELKKAHRDRVREKRKELEKALRLQESMTVRPGPQRRTRRAARR